MATTEQPYTRVAKAVVADIGRAATTGADELLPGGGPGAERTTRAAMIAHVRAAWPYPDLRQQIFARMVPAVQGPDGKVYPARNGLKNWEEMVAAAFPQGYPEPPPPPPMMGADAGGFVPPTQAGFAPSPNGVPY